MQRGNILLVSLLLIVLMAGGGYLAYTKGNLSFNKNMQTSDQTVSIRTNVPVASDKISLSITSPINGSILKSTSVAVTGKTSPNAEVFINDFDTKADANGNFSYKITLDEGQNDIVVIANDADGNMVEQDFSVNVQTF